MKIRLQILGTVAARAMGMKTREELGVVISDDAVVSDLLYELDIDIEAVIVMVNGQSRKLDHRLEDGDEVDILDLILGG